MSILRYCKEFIEQVISNSWFRKKEIRREREKDENKRGEIRREQKREIEEKKTTNHANLGDK